jgi:uncharacterized protein HemX
MYMASDAEVDHSGGQRRAAKSLDAIGAAAGAGTGLIGRRRKEQQAEEAEAQQAAATEEQRATYQRALSACLEGRGYTIK